MVNVLEEIEDDLVIYDLLDVMYTAEDALDNDEISSAEAGFIQGWNEA